MFSCSYCFMSAVFVNNLMIHNCSAMVSTSTQLYSMCSFVYFYIERSVFKCDAEKIIWTFWLNAVQSSVFIVNGTVCSPKKHTTQLHKNFSNDAIFSSSFYCLSSLSLIANYIACFAFGWSMFLFFFIFSEFDGSHRLDWSSSINTVHVLAEFQNHKEMRTCTLTEGNYSICRFEYVMDEITYGRIQTHSHPIFFPVALEFIWNEIGKTSTKWNFGPENTKNVVLL